MFRAPRRDAIIALLICSALAGMFAWLSYTAILTKSATLDEPLHTASAYAATYMHDYRLDVENPPLWKYWAMLFMRRDALRIDTHSSEWTDARTPGGGQTFATRILYQTPPNNGIAVINAARAAMLVIGVTVLALAAAWAYRLAGAAAAIATAALIAFDPTFLAHAPIVKNDLALTLCVLVLVMGLSSAMRKLTVWNVLIIALACGAAVTVKLSGMLFIVIAAVAVTRRALGRESWIVVGKTYRSRARKMLTAVIVTCAIAVVAWGSIWAAYGFRYNVVSDARPYDLEQISRETGLDTSPMPVRATLWIDRHHLLPQPWSAGFLGLQRAMIHHQNYLLGQVKWGGWWYYFPIAIVVKTPLATLAAGALALLLLVLRRVPFDHPLRTIAIASIIYLLAAAAQNINHGVRHLLPIYPLLFVEIAVVFAKVLMTRRRAALIVGVALLLALAAESLASYPNYIAFFNPAAGRTLGGFRILADSNLDWGQDLPQLADWRRRHPDVTIYLAYYGAADPAAYGIDYINLPSGFFLGPEPRPLTSPGVVAISATRLQGLYMSDELRRSYQRMQHWPIREILPGGTIYLFDYPPPAGE